MIIKARVMTKPKANTCDPQGAVVQKNLEGMGIKYLKKVSVGRYIELQVEDAPDEEIKSNILSRDIFLFGVFSFINNLVIFYDRII